MFYIKRLESADSKMLIQIKKLLRLFQYNKYKIEKIKDYDLETHQYIVKWKRYPKKKNIWELIEYFEDCKKIIRKSEYLLGEENAIIKNSDFQELLIRKQK